MNIDRKTGRHIEIEANIQKNTCREIERWISVHEEIASAEVSICTEKWGGPNV